MWKVKKSKVHGTGVFAIENIKKGTLIIEYVGEKVTKKEGDIRSEKRINKYLNSKTQGSVYIFELNKRYDIDGSPRYNKARYINHSCSPNCEVEIINGHIWIKSIKRILKNQEILPTLPDIWAPVSTDSELVLSLPSIVPELDTSKRSAVMSPVILPSTFRCSLLTFP